MSTKNKTAYTAVNVINFIDSFVEKEQKKKDSFRLLELMREWSGFEPEMWEPTIIGFGNYHYKYASGHEGNAPIIAFSPRKAAFSLYIYTPGEHNDILLNQLGKYKMGKSCIYFKTLEDLNLEVLEQLSKATIKYITENYEHVSC